MILVRPVTSKKFWARYQGCGDGLYSFRAKCSSDDRIHAERVSPESQGLHTKLLFCVNQIICIDVSVSAAIPVVGFFGTIFGMEYFIHVTSHQAPVIRAPPCTRRMRWVTFLNSHLAFVFP